MAGGTKRKLSDTNNPSKSPSSSNQAQSGTGSARSSFVVNSSPSGPAAAEVRAAADGPASKRPRREVASSPPKHQATLTPTLKSTPSTTLPHATVSNNSSITTSSPTGMPSIGAVILSAYGLSHHLSLLQSMADQGFPEDRVAVAIAEIEKARRRGGSGGSAEASPTAATKSPGVRTSKRTSGTSSTSAVASTSTSSTGAPVSAPPITVSLLLDYLLPLGDFFDTLSHRHASSLHAPSSPYYLPPARSSTAAHRLENRSLPCVVCWDEPVGSVFRPCGHACACGEHAAKVAGGGGSARGLSYVCRATVRGFDKIFLG
ncbi:hypothetical protein M427DRAFT_155247 [Gonapodya prolifera JEL478]|uniref:RING-type domain-containing protein n=1 Tax=Gonapodya prolifera (strain JEL478) TaxID=1344416 RepID=A0A139AFN4_GONPJ|nr:hypothetical protein M427DRAFT_155247 [Gonapodya prolifera JEL478]|eukprot:KXS15509.1 hypothetical protein M427DRAFT_155247 [Gonapodya prolifera JEL478]